MVMMAATKKRHRYQLGASSAKSSCNVQPGDVGFLITCVRGRERATGQEVLDLLAHYTTHAAVAHPDNAEPVMACHQAHAKEMPLKPSSKLISDALGDELAMLRQDNAAAAKTTKAATSSFACVR